MQKELNPDLFGGISRNQGRVATAVSSSPAAEPVAVADIDRRILELRGQIQNLVAQLNQFGKQVEEALKGQQSAIEGLQRDFHRLDSQVMESSSNQMQSQYRMQSQTQESRQIEKKVELMLERHQGVLRNYEVRVNQLQRLIDKKDEQLLALQSSLMETKTEIARLKRI